MSRRPAPPGASGGPNRRTPPRAADGIGVTRGGIRLSLAIALALCLALLVPAGASAAKYASRTLKMGTQGKDVAALQGYLTKLGVPTSRDGAFGKGTRSSVLELEKKRRWKRDGKVPPKQARQIRALAQKQKKSQKKKGGNGDGDAGRFYFAGGSAPALQLEGESAGTAAVDVVSSGGTTVLTIDVTLGSGSGGGGGVGVGGTFTGTASWYGRGSNGSPAPDGSYSLELADKGGTGARVTGGDRGSFEHYNNIFPLRAPHDYGGSASRFGAPRPGHIHQGQDVSAACGSRLVAVQGGTVVYTGYQAGGAGNYIVIHGKGSGRDYVYMHMVKPAIVSKGQKLKTGQKIGKAGNTGSSFGCHLHFERWTKPGWYSGGNPTDPLKSLKYWDGYS
ncbi:MAG: hypothetical protein EXQ70_10290 [Solirubrobacterales bacterium]|nr:hypothetical protein [Solirubrobacterales bacterium]